MKKFDFKKIFSSGNGILLLGILWLIFWLGPALFLFKEDLRWGHNYAIPIIFIIVAFIDYREYAEFVRDNNTWIIELNINSLWTIAYLLYILLLLISCFVFLILWNINSTSEKDSGQSIGTFRKNG